jgi:hypothetical protein
VFNICDGLGLAPDDPRGLTVTGGLPFFGGAGNNYSMHAIAETVQRARANPGSYGLVGANGGIMSKYSAGVYSTTPAAWTPDRSAELQAEIDGWPAPEQARYADGPATIETYTVTHRRDGSRTGVVVGRLDRDGRRFVAKGDDPGLLDLLSTAKGRSARRLRPVVRLREPGRHQPGADGRAVPAGAAGAARGVRARAGPPRRPPARGHHQPPRVEEQPAPDGERRTRPQSSTPTSPTTTCGSRSSDRGGGEGLLRRQRPGLLRLG